MLDLPRAEPQFGDDFSRMYGGWAKSVTFIVCHNCSMICTYCYEHNKGNRVMSLETAKQCVDLLFDEDEKNDQYINDDAANGIILDFIGGEPLLEIKLIDQIMDYFIYTALERNHRWANRFMISMSSNGTEYFKPEVQDFIRKWDGRVHIGITIDGNQELHDSCRRLVDGSPSYHLAAAAFNDIKERFGQDGTKLTLSPQNLKYLFTACKDMIETFDLKYLQGNPIFEAEWTNEEATLYYRELKKLADWLIESGRWEKTWIAFFSDFIGHALPEEDNRCYCGGSSKMIAFDVDGKMYPCLRFAPISIGPDKAAECVIGDCENGFYQDGFYSCLNCTTRRSESTDECWSCPIASGCASCTAWDYECGGLPIKRSTNICPMHKARVLATAYYYNTLYRLHGEPDRFELHVPSDWAIPIIGQQEYEMLVEVNA